MDTGMDDVKKHRKKTCEYYHTYYIHFIYYENNNF